jgi:type II secretory pathway component PulF
MSVYTYSALNERGKVTKGVINADSPRAARGKLRQAGLFATDILETAEAEAHGGGRNLSNLSLLQRVRPQDLTVMTRQFATLMAANLTVVEALTALIEQTDSRPLQKRSSRYARASTRATVWQLHCSSTREFFRVCLSTWPAPAKPAVPCRWLCCGWRI